MNTALCSAFGACASCVLASDYESQKELKITHTKELFGDIWQACGFAGECCFFDTSESGFRSRAEFRLWHDEKGVHYAMSGADKKPVIISSCAIVDSKIASLMPRILEKINSSFALKERIFGCEFVAGSDEIMAILLYHKDIESIKSELESLANELKISLIARSKGKKLAFGSEILEQKISVNSRILRYKISPDGFIQPNASANEKMLNFVYSRLKKHDKNDLCELYCGHGNFSVALAPLFSKVLATEINKASTALAKQNAGLNGVENLEFARLSAAEFAQALRGEREFRRLSHLELKSYDFSHILVDPPRAGCDEGVLSLMSEFQNIIYISCSQESLKRDLQILAKTHKITDFALFDQFAHTKHIESIVLLNKNPKF